jgi:uncharacterized membrane protein YgcG
MPDSFLPPSGGPGSFDERDLDAVLSGETADIPLALGPVADTLAALRGAPTPAELGGEAAILAEFRAEIGGPAGPAQTLVLPARTDGRPPRRAPRHRARRRPVPSVSRRAGALMGVAAAVLIGIVVASGNLPGPIARITHIGHTSSASPSATHSSGGNPLGTGAKPTKSATPADPDPAPTRSQVFSSPTPSPSPSPSKLCQEYYGYYLHPELAGMPAHIALYQQLSELFHSLRVFPHCIQYLGGMFHQDPGTGPRDSQNQNPGKAPANAAKANPSPGASSAPTAQGATGSGNGSGSSGPGGGSQGGGPGSNP